MKNNTYRKILSITFLLAAMFLCSACSMPRSGNGLRAGKSRQSAENVNAAKQAGQNEDQSTADIPKTNGEYYLIVKNDLQNYQLTLMKLSDAAQICYEYTEGTEFFDKYGNYAMSQEFSEGKLVVIQRLNSNDTLGAIAFTDQTWDYENVRNYSIDAEKRRIDIADTSYQIDTFAKIFSEGEETDIFAVGDNDILNVYGIGRTVYAVVIETGHGMLALTNTELFEGGWVNLGTKVYSKITKNMTMELPEGIYDFSVANDGYGDSGEVRIRRDKITTIDLNDYKGEGPKMCRVTFDVGVKGAVLTVNGKKIDYAKPLELRYGVYTLGVYAKGYDTWNRQLVINSPKAKIEILLSEASNSNADTGTANENNSDNSAQSDSSSTASSQTENRRGIAGSMAGSKTRTDSGSSAAGSSDNEVNSALANAALGSSLASIITGGDSTDYLDTLSDLVDSLDKLKRSSSGRSED